MTGVYRRRPRYPRPRRFIWTVGGGAVSETPTPGGAIASGNALVAVVSQAIGGALAQGNELTAAAILTSAGAIAGGNELLVLAGHTTGGALAQGLSPEPAVVNLTIAGALAGGFGPGEDIASVVPMRTLLGVGV